MGWEGGKKRRKEIRNGEKGGYDFAPHKTDIKI